MGTVTAHMIVGIIIIGQGVDVGVIRHGLMEGRVEHHHLRSLGKHLGDGTDAEQVGRIVKRREVAAYLDLAQHFFIYQAAAVEEIGALDYTVADGIHIVERLEHAVLRIDEGVHHQFHSDFVVGDGKGEHERLAACGLMGDISFGKTDFLYQSLCLDAVVGGAFHIEKLIFDRGTAAVDDEYDHIM